MVNISDQSHVEESHVNHSQLEEVARHYSGPAYEVMYLLHAEPDAVAKLRAELDSMGDSLVLVGGGGLWNVHVHVDDAGAAVEAGMRAGEPFQVRITHLEPVGAAPKPSAVGNGHGGRRLVAVTHGPGTAGLLSEADAQIVPAAPRQHPSTGEILSAIRQTHADEVVVLPGDSDTRGAAELAAEQARLDGVRVAVIPTRSIVQTLAAAALHDPTANFDDDVVAMTAAAGATQYAAVTEASRDALTTAGACRTGDILGLLNGDIAVIGSAVDDVARDLLSRMLAGAGDLVTLVLGAEADASLRQGLPAWIETTFPMTEVVVHEGGQPLWPVIMGVE